MKKAKIIFDIYKVHYDKSGNRLAEDEYTIECLDRKEAQVIMDKDLESYHWQIEQDGVYTRLLCNEHDLMASNLPD